MNETVVLNLLFIHTYLPTYLHTYIYTYIHAYLHAYIHAYKHTLHTYKQTNPPRRVPRREHPKATRTAQQEVAKKKIQPGWTFSLGNSLQKSKLWPPRSQSARMRLSHHYFCRSKRSAAAPQALVADSRTGRGGMGRSPSRSAASAFRQEHGVLSHKT